MEDKNWIDQNGRIDFEILEEGARRKEAERTEQYQLYREKESARQEEKAAKLSALLEKVAVKTEADNKAKADAAIAEELAQAEAEIREKQNKLHNVTEETEERKAWREMFGELKKND